MDSNSVPATETNCLVSLDEQCGILFLLTRGGLREPVCSLEKSSSIQYHQLRQQALLSWGSLHKSMNFVDWRYFGWQLLRQLCSDK